jgi:hypothetical protein
MKKYRSERNGRRSFDMAVHYNVADMLAREWGSADRRLCGPRL